MNSLQTGQNLFDIFAPSVRALPEASGPQRLTNADLLTPEFRLHQDGHLSVYYAPFDHVNQDAKVALAGINPGWTQMEIAYRSASRDLRGGLVAVEACRRAKRRASFADSIRKKR